MSDFVTLRPYLTGSLNDVVESTALGALGRCSVVCELVSIFVDYHEEGASLYLDAFITDNLGNLIALLPNSDHLQLGVTQCDEEGVRKAVKKVAPLVRGCWKMYLAQCAGGMEYGLFRDSGHPLNVPIDLAVNTGGVGNVKFIRVTKLTHDAVRVCSHHGKEVVVHFTNDKKSVADSGKSLVTLSKVICSRLDEKRRGSVETYYAALLTTAVRASHGALVAVVSMSKPPKCLGDCTPLLPPINFCEAVESVRSDANFIPRLQALENVVIGMFCCDGIVVFDTQANVVAYNAFIKLKASNVVGGARRRAYQALKDKIGKGVVAAYYQSQDGASELQVVNA